MKRYFSILKDHYQALSLREFVAFVIDAMFKSETSFVYVASLGDVNTMPRTTDRARQVRKGELDELHRERERMEVVPWEFRCDLYDGVEDFFVYRDAETDKIGHISWLYYKGDPNRTLHLGDKECEIKFCLTLPEFRGRGLYPRALREIQQYLTERGYQHCFICVDDDNAASIRGIEKAQFRRVGSVCIRKVLGFQVSRRLDTRDVT